MLCEKIGSVMNRPASGIFIRGFFPIIAVGAVLFLYNSACVRFVPPALEDPAVIFDRIVFSSGLNQKDDWAEPVGEKTRFEKGVDSRVYAFLNFGEVRGAHILLWKWYDPSRNLYRVTDAIGLGAEGKIHDRYIAWDVIFITGDKPSGQWTVVVFLDGDLMAVKDFEIK